eukprot:TRINITY_DN20044_c0_g1_i1.p1 TRINITY_DN20044_c0_g1~~TRINITY_DN20044_c0_g1_i1.p1  ORF type:complete len:471 (-),score=111.14 TRINITY_DN20044_c0_g1_i1:100-1512(-)
MSFPSMSSSHPARLFSFFSLLSSMAQRRHLLFTALCVCIFVAPAMARHSTIEIIDRGANWVFLDKFCFETSSHSMESMTDRNTAHFRFKVHSGGSKNAVFVAYDDASDSFPAFYSHKHHKSCLEKLRIPPALHVFERNGTKDAFEGSLYVNHEGNRPHFWYFALADCVDGRFSGKTKIEVWMTNPGDVAKHEFSVDENAMFGLYMFLLFSQGYLFLLLLRNVFYMKKTTSSMHPIVQVFLGCVSLYTVSVLMNFVHWMIYADNGVGIPGMRHGAQIGEMVSLLLFMLVLFLIAVGFGISRPFIPHRRTFFTMFSVLLILHLFLYLWMQIGVDPASTIYEYETVPGLIIVFLRIPIVGFFVYCLRETIKLERNAPPTLDVEGGSPQVLFYKMFGMTYIAWFFVLPITVIIAALSDPWVRAKIVSICAHVFFLFAQGGMIGIMWPSRVEAVFRLRPISDAALHNHKSPYEEL